MLNKHFSDGAQKKKEKERKLQVHNCLLCASLTRMLTHYLPLPLLFIIALKNNFYTQL